MARLKTDKPYHGKSSKRPVQMGFAEIFTNPVKVFSQRSTAADKNIRKNCLLADVTQPSDARTAPNVRHRPVNRLHSIEKSVDTVPHFPLTPKMKRVKP